MHKYFSDMQIIGLHSSSEVLEICKQDVIADLRISVLEDKLNRANSMLSQLLVRVTTPQPQTNNCMPSCSRNDIEFSSYQAPSYDEIEKLRPIFLPNCGKPKETLNEREPLKMTIKRPNGGSLLTVQLNSNSNAPDKPARDPSCESPLKIAKKLSDVDAGKMPKLNETLSFLERRSTEYFEKRMREGHSKEKTTSLSCTICSEEVHIHKNTLTNHLYKHTKAPLFKCSYCEFTNNHSHLIIQHTRVAHPDKPPYDFTDRTPLFDMELSEIAFKAFFDFKKFANLDKQ
ncbi:hypothetical protein WR25_06768 isoform B [Diploscapter pachys]|uniref:C2H2-type domain-containing protein n=1 Tax=Diploscapter pachys TaxID=2018661 RepID=A0A2A2J495_9BILA|nr:hypothetical protein WR25_06768 isoform B [Diploscapter pachys]